MSNIVDDFSSKLWYNSSVKECVESHHGNSPVVAFVVEKRNYAWSKVMSFPVTRRYITRLTINKKTTHEG